MKQTTLQLLHKQKEHFPRILKELKEHRCKRSHWAWYVWPTEKKGFSELPPRTCLALDDVGAFLESCDIRMWTEILVLINKLIKEQGSPELVIPRIDFGRIIYFFSFFLDKASAHTELHPFFYEAIIEQFELFEGA